MQQLIRPVSIALLTLAFAVGLAGPASAGEQVERPHQAEAFGTNTIVVEECVGTIVVTCPQETTTTLIGTHLGRSVSTGTGSATLDFGAPPCIGTGGAPGTPFISVQDVVTAAADGDELYSLNVTTGCFVDFGVETLAVGTYTITGGTGRFAGATGSGSLVATVLDTALHTTWEGTLTY